MKTSQTTQLYYGTKNKNSTNENYSLFSKFNRDKNQHKCYKTISELFAARQANDLDEIRCDLNCLEEKLALDKLEQALQGQRRTLPPEHHQGGAAE